MGKYADIVLGGSDSPSTSSKYADMVIGSPHKVQIPQERDEVPVLASIGRGMMDMGQGIKQVALKTGNAAGLVDDQTVADYDAKVSDELAHYNYDKGPGFDGWRLAGNVAATTPFGLAKMPQTLLGRVVQGSGVGAGIGALTATGENDSRLINSGIGMVGGGVAPVLFQGLATGGKYVADKAKNLFSQFSPNNSAIINNIDIKFANLPAAIRENLKQQARVQLAQTGRIDDAAIERIAQAESLGFTGAIKPTAGQASRDPMVWTRERNMMKVDGVGDDFIARFRGQDQQFKQIMDDLAASTGKSVDDVIDAGESIMTAVRSRYEQTQKVVSSLYTQAREKYGDIGGINVAGLINKADDLGVDESLRPITNSVINVLKRRGYIDNDGNLTGKTMSIIEAEGIRKQIRKFGGDNPANNWVKKQIIDQLDNDVFDAIGDDVFKQARQAAASRFSEFEQKIANSIIDGKMGDKAFNSILKSDVADVRALFSTLSKAPGGNQAVANFKGQVVEFLNSKATQGNGADGVFNGTAFKRALDSIGRKKLEVIFGDQTDFLYTVARVGMDMTKEPAWAAVNYSNSAPALLNYLGAGTKSLPFFGDALKQRSASLGAQRLLNNSFDPVKQAAMRHAAVQQMMNSYGGQLVNRGLPILGATGMDGLLSGSPNFK